MKARLAAGFAAAAWLLGTAATQAAMPEWRTPTTAELSMTSEPQAPGAAAIILYMEVTRNDSVLREDRYTQIKVLTDEGRKFADIRISYERGEEYLREIEARTIRPDGTVVPFTGKIEEMPLASGADGKVLGKVLTLPDVTIGSIIEYRYSRREYTPYSAKWPLSNDLFTREALYRFKSRGGYRYGTPRGVPPGTSPLGKGANDFIELRTRNVQAFVAEELMPPALEVQPRLDVTYAWDWERMSKDAAQFWSRFAEEERAKTEALFRRSKLLRAVASEIAPPGDAPEVRLRKLYEACAALRNLSYESERTEAEIRRDRIDQIDDLRDVWNRKTGWALQINLLFFGLVREAGFEAGEVWVADRGRVFFSSNQMDPGPLDLRMVGVKTASGYLYLSPGTPYLSYGAVPWAWTGLASLRIDKSSHEWVTIPAPRARESRSTREAHLSISPTGELRGRVEVIHTGHEAYWRRHRENNEDAPHRRNFLQEDLRASLRQEAVVTVVDEPDWDGSGDFIVTYEVTIPQRVVRAGARRIMPLALFAAGHSDVFQRTERLHPIYVRFPFEVVEDVTIEFPPRWRLDKLPDGDLNETERLAYSILPLKVGGDAETLRVQRRFRNNLTLVPADGYAALRSFFDAVRAADEQQVVLLASEP